VISWCKRDYGANCLQYFAVLSLCWLVYGFHQINAFVSAKNWSVNIYSFGANQIDWWRSWCIRFCFTAMCSFCSISRKGIWRANLWETRLLLPCQIPFLEICYTNYVLRMGSIQFCFCNSSYCILVGLERVNSYWWKVVYMLGCSLACIPINCGWGVGLNRVSSVYGGSYGCGKGWFSAA